MLDKKTHQTIKSILHQYLPGEYHAFIFGSRASQRASKFSDIDLGIEGSKSLNLDSYFKLESAFEESDLPYRVDLVDFTKVTPQFRLIASQHKYYLT